MTPVQRLPILPDVPCRGDALGWPVYWLGTQWAVTFDGVEARDGTYVVEKARVWEENTPGYGWERHMAGKGWVDIEDFQAAMAFARARWPRGRAVRENRPRRPGTFPQTRCMIAWTPQRIVPIQCKATAGRVAVGPWPDEIGWSDRFTYTTGACYAELHVMPKWRRVAELFRQFHDIVVRDGIDPQVAHRALLAVDEYRAVVGRPAGGDASP